MEAGPAFLFLLLDDHLRRLVGVDVLHPQNQGNFESCNFVPHFQKHWQWQANLLHFHGHGKLRVRVALCGTNVSRKPFAAQAGLPSGAFTLVRILHGHLPGRSIWGLPRVCTRFASLGCSLESGLNVMTLVFYFVFCLPHSNEALQEPADLLCGLASFFGQGVPVYLACVCQKVQTFTPGESTTDKDDTKKKSFPVFKQSGQRTGVFDEFSHAKMADFKCGLCATWGFRFKHCALWSPT